MTTAFHNAADLGSTAYEPLDWPIERIRERTLSYAFRTHFHPYVGQLVHRLVTDSIDGLQGADTEDVTRPDGTVVTLPDGSPRPVLYQDLMTDRQYGPTALVTEPYPVADLDFSTSGGVRRLQLGAVLPRAAHGGDPPEPQRAVRGGAALVPLRLRPDRRQRRPHPAAVLEGPPVPAPPTSSRSTTS